jgi:hypothetical protein
MPASKVTNQDVQYALSAAQRCKCENRCVNCFKLQSELNEVKMELKSIKEIVIILNRDLACACITYMNKNHLTLLWNHLKTGPRDVLHRRPTVK